MRSCRWLCSPVEHGVVGSGAAAAGLLAASQYGSGVGKAVQCNFTPRRVQMWLSNHRDLNDMDSIWALVVRDGMRGDHSALESCMGELLLDGHFLC